MHNITPNPFAKLEDLHLNSEHGIQKINVLLFTDQNNKPYWTKEYRFLPHYERYNEAVKGIKETDFLEYNCRIVKNENNEIEIVTRNAFGKPAAIYWQQQEVIRKIKKTLAIEIKYTTDLERVKVMKESGRSNDPKEFLKSFYCISYI